MKQAQEELQRGKYERAAHDFGTLCRAQSHNALAQFGLGLSLASMGRLQDALIALEQANKLAPVSVQILLALAKVEIGLGNYKDSELRLMEAEKLQPGNPQLGAQLGLLAIESYLAQKRNAQAIEKSKTLSAQFPQNAPVHAQLGIFLFQAGELREAEAELDLTHMLNPVEAGKALERVLLTDESPQIHLTVLGCYQRWNRLAAARDVLERLISQAPENVLYRADLVETDVLAGEIDSAKENLSENSLRLSGGVHAALGEWLVTQHQEGLALAELLRAQALGVQGSRITLALATLQAKGGAYRDASHNATRVEQDSSLDGDVRAAAALLAGGGYMSAGADKEAIEHLKHAIELAPETEANYLALARVFEVLKSHKAAVEVLSQGRIKTSASPDLLVALGSDLVLVEQFSPAIEILNAVIAQAPDRTDAYMPLARAFRLTGQAALATAAMRRLVERQPRDAMVRVMLAESLIEEGQRSLSATCPGGGGHTC